MTVPARLDASGYERTAEHVARLARVDWVADGAAEPVATVPVAGGTVALFAPEGVDLEAGRRRTEKRRATLRAEIERAEGKLANERFVARRRRRWSRPSATSSSRCGTSSKSSAERRAGRSSRARLEGPPMSAWSAARAEEHLLSLELFGMRFGLERMRRR